MSERINKPRGTTDFLFEEEKLFTTVEKHLFKDASNFGAKRVEGPLFEEEKLFVRGVGQSTDIVNKEMFRLDTKGDHSYVLRPEFTASINRLVIENKLYSSPDLPLKISYCGPVFRYERPQAGRLREFNQFGVEFLDNKIDFSTALDALLLLYRAGVNLLGRDLLLKVNFLGSFESRENYKKALKEFYKDKIDHMCEDCKVRYNQNVLRILDCKVEADIEINKKAPNLQDYLSVDDKMTFEKLISILDKLKVNYQIDSKLVRGLDYYTGLVFELYDPLNLNLGAIGAGGQYGNLMAEIGGPDFEGIGFSFGIERLLLALSQDRKEELLKEQDDSLDYFIIDLRKEKDILPLILADQLRKLDKKVSTPSASKALSGALKMANRLQSKKVLIFDDYNPGALLVKDMAKHSQNVINSNDLDQILKELGEKE